VRGVAVTTDDAFRAEIIEALMCDFEADVDTIRRSWGQREDALASAQITLAGFAADGLVDWQGPVLRVTDVGRPFVRQVCAAFDTYLDPAALRHSKAV
jgi:oxygen-independent coproporphyrinogen-3 oxidase